MSVMVVNGRNVNEVFANGLRWLLVAGSRENSRNGTVLVAPGPVVSVYQNPTERVLFLPSRDANPFFHLMEAIWMLAGQNDVKFPRRFNSRFGEYSDDGVTIPGAYGHRWRNAFGLDQLSFIVRELRNNKESRRAVLQMWSPEVDIRAAERGGRDVPCNTAVYFDGRHGALNMTITCRSNDAIWGAYGANAVHFSILQEYVAVAVGLPVGELRQLSNNFHAYTDVYSEEQLRKMSENAEGFNLYATGQVTPYAMVLDPSRFLDDCARFMANPQRWSYDNPFFNDVCWPMYAAWENHEKWRVALRNWQATKEVAYAEEAKDAQEKALAHVAAIVAPDWRVACHQWLSRRYTDA